MVSDETERGFVFSDESLPILIWFCEDQTYGPSSLLSTRSAVSFSLRANRVQLQEEVNRKNQIQKACLSVSALPGVSF